jgi:hypothetical protein
MPIRPITRITSETITSIKENPFLLGDISVKPPAKINIREYDLKFCCAKLILLNI